MAVGHHIKYLFAFDVIMKKVYCSAFEAGTATNDFQVRFEIQTVLCCFSKLSTLKTDWQWHASRLCQSNNHNIHAYMFPLQEPNKQTNKTNAISHG